MYYYIIFIQILNKFIKLFIIDEILFLNKKY